MESDPKAQLIDLFDREVHLPAMAAQPHPFSEEHRGRLLALQRAIRAELEFLRSRPSGEDVASSFLARAQSGALDHIDNHAQFVGLPGVREVLGRFRALAEELGTMRRDQDDLHNAPTVQNRLAEDERVLSE